MFCFRMQMKKAARNLSEIDTSVSKTLQPLLQQRFSAIFLSTPALAGETDIQGSSSPTPLSIVWRVFLKKTDFSPGRRKGRPLSR